MLLPSPARRSAALLVLLLHLGLLLLLTHPAERLPAPRTALQLELKRVEPPPARALPRVPLQPALGLPAQPILPLPSWTERPPGLEPAATAAPPGLDTPAAPSPPGAAPLDLRLPARTAPATAPSLHEQIRADRRANSPRESAAERMANALGAKGWQVLDLGDGGKKVTGPYGECQIIRPSMVDGIAGHPHAGLLPARVFPCGGIEKGSKVAERPK